MRRNINVKLQFIYPIAWGYHHVDTQINLASRREEIKDFLESRARAFKASAGIIEFLYVKDDPFGTETQQLQEGDAIKCILLEGDETSSMLGAPLAMTTNHLPPATYMQEKPKVTRELEHASSVGTTAKIKLEFIHPLTWGGAQGIRQIDPMINMGAFETWLGTHARAFKSSSKIIEHAWGIDPYEMGHRQLQDGDLIKCILLDQDQISLLLHSALAAGPTQNLSSIPSTVQVQPNVIHELQSEINKGQASDKGI